MVAELFRTCNEDISDTIRTYSPSFTPIVEAAFYGHPILDFVLEWGKPMSMFAKNSLGVGALLMAARRSAFKALKRLLDGGGAGPAAYDRSDEARRILWEPLRDSALYGYPQCVKAIISCAEEFELYINELDPIGAVLHTAVETGRLDIAGIAIECGTETSLRPHSLPPALLRAVDNGDAKMVEFLLAHGADIEVAHPLDPVISRTMRKTALGRASFSKDDANIFDCLLRRGARINHIPAGSQSPLFSAAYTGQIDKVRTLLERGADVNAAVDIPEGWSPVNAAYDNPEILEVLLEFGADVNNVSSAGSVLFQAIEWGYPKTVEALLASKTVPNLEQERRTAFDGRRNENRAFKGLTALCLACLVGNAGIIRALLEAGADPRHSPGLISDPLMLCMENASKNGSSVDALRTLLEY